jgi:hypothetical protein
MAINKIIRNSITGDAVDATKIADDAISEEHLDITTLTDQTELSATAADDDILLVYDTSAGTLKKIQKSNVSLSNPTFSSVSPTSLLSGDGTGNHTIVITGTKFDASATFKLRTDGGTDISMDSVVRNSSTQLTGTVAKNTANLTNANEPFDIIVTNGNGLAITTENQLNIDASPVYVTSAGTLGTVTGGSAISTIDVVAADPESTGNVTFELQSGSLPAGLSSATVNENGVSKFRITGTPTNPVANTTTNFTLRAVDAASNTTSRAFSITVNRAFTSQSFTASGTFAVPSGVTSLNSVLVVAAGGGGGGDNGGGGGAGGLIFMPEVTVTPSGTITVTIGDGSAPAGNSLKGENGGNTIFGASPSPGIAAALTAIGGGAGAGSPGGDNTSGGSGGGAAGHGDNSSGEVATQPTQPGNSGAYGFGNNGGNSNPGTSPRNGGGGGGAGAVGGNAGNYAGQGGDGKAYTIADGTTPVYYAGGGGGGVGQPNISGSGGQGGGGGGGSPSGGSGSGTPTGASGTANSGGGGGGGANACPRTGGTGGKGIVVVRY